MQDFRGARWYKCDLHLHTTASKCFDDKNVTAVQWADRAIEQGLDCVAVTDHNSPLGIKAIQEASQGKNLTVFPGVEITCDTSKIHLLVLFDPSKGVEEVKSLLSKCDIEHNVYGEQNTTTTKSVFEIADIVKDKCDALIIPAHIDEFAGLCNLSPQNLGDFYNRSDINAVQVVHKLFDENEYTKNTISEIIPYLNDYYNNPLPKIDDDKAYSWYRAVEYAKNKELAILTFSDNPHAPKNSSHGLYGIGTRFSYIKMDEKPTLEGLRQAFLLPSHRVVNDFDNIDAIIQKSDFWIKSITNTDTSLTGEVPFKVDFNPQLNTIIGGRGSGKSSILRFIRGVFNRTNNLESFTELITEHNNFYKVTELKGIEEIGVFNEDSTILIEFVRKDFLYRVKASNIISSTSQFIEIHRLDDDVWTAINDDEFLNFLEFEQYSQKQIFEISKNPNALLERIDINVEEINNLKDKREVTKENYLKSCSTIRAYQVKLKSRLKLKTDIEDLKKKLQTLDKAGIKDLMAEKKIFENEEKLLDNHKKQIENLLVKLEDFRAEFNLDKFDIDVISVDYKEEIEGVLSVIDSEVIKQYKVFENLINSLEQVKTNLELKISSSNWKESYVKAISDYDKKKKELEAEGVVTIDQYEEISKEIESKTLELAELNVINESKRSELEQRDKYQAVFVEICKDITNKRKEFIQQNISDKKIKVKINPFRNQTNFELQIRQIINKDTSFESDFIKLKELCFQGNVEKNIEEVRKEFRENHFEDKSTIVKGKFKNVIHSITSSAMDELELFMPEDEVVVQYKPENSDKFKPLSTASAGQKTTAILTFLLSFGSVPLLLDQPEDDLDNRLVYDLIVDRLKIAKDNRQIIVVTHNANIPVNGDAEYIISMDSESQYTSILNSGTVERDEIKREICDVMEGSEKAFRMRSERYKVS